MVNTHLIFKCYVRFVATIRSAGIQHKRWAKVTEKHCKLLQMKDGSSLLIKKQTNIHMKCAAGCSEQQTNKNRLFNLLCKQAPTEFPALGAPLRSRDWPLTFTCRGDAVIVWRSCRRLCISLLTRKIGIVLALTQTGTVCMKVQESELGPLIVQHANQAPMLQLSSYLALGALNWLMVGLVWESSVVKQGKFGFQHEQHQNFTLNKLRRQKQEAGRSIKTRN